MIRMTDFDDAAYATMFGFRQTDPDAGVFYGEHGIVRAIWSSKRTVLVFLRGGRTFQRSWARRWPPRTIARLARQFENDVVNGRVG